MSICLIKSLVVSANYKAFIFMFFKKYLLAKKYLADRSSLTPDLKLNFY